MTDNVKLARNILADVDLKLQALHEIRANLSSKKHLKQPYDDELLSDVLVQIDELKCREVEARIVIATGCS